MATLGDRRAMTGPGIEALIDAEAAARTGAGVLAGLACACLGGVGGRVRIGLPHHAQIQDQPRTRERHTAQRPGGERNSSSKAIGPRIAPNGTQM